MKRPLIVFLLLVVAPVGYCVFNYYHIQSSQFTPEEFDAGMQAQLSTQEEWNTYIRSVHTWAYGKMSAAEWRASVETGKSKIDPGTPMNLFPGKTPADAAWRYGICCTTIHTWTPIMTRLNYPMRFMILSKDLRVIGAEKP